MSFLRNCKVQPESFLPFCFSEYDYKRKYVVASVRVSDCLCANGDASQTQGVNMQARPEQNKGRKILMLLINSHPGVMRPGFCLPRNSRHFSLFLLTSFLQMQYISSSVITQPAELARVQTAKHCVVESTIYI